MYKRQEENRELVKDFLYDVMQGNNADNTPDYFDGDEMCIRDRYTIERGYGIIKKKR